MEILLQIKFSRTQFSVYSRSTNGRQRIQTCPVASMAGRDMDDDEDNRAVFIMMKNRRCRPVEVTRHS